MTNLDFQLYFVPAIFVGMTAICLYFINKNVEDEIKNNNKKMH